MKYAWITKHRDSFPIALMCEVLDVSTVGLLRLGRPRAEPARRRRARIDAAVRQVHAESHGIYGSGKIAQELAGAATSWSRPVATRWPGRCGKWAWRAASRRRLRRRPRRPIRRKQPAPNMLDRDFTATRPNQKWVTDITYLPTLAGWVYLAVVLDLFSRKVVGWSIGDSLATPLVADASATGDRIAAAGRQGAVAPQRPRLPVHERRLPADLEDPGHRVLDESHRRMLRQRRRRTVLLVAQARVDEARVVRRTWKRPG